jgi:Lon-like protease
MTTTVRAEHASAASRLPSGADGEDHRFVARLAERVRDGVGWDERHRALGQHPVFARCARQEIRWLARHGDFVRIEAGGLVWEKDRVAHWLLVIVEGEVEVDSRPRVRVGPAGQLGAELILAFAPTPARVQAVTTVDAFALKREHLLGIAHRSSIRAGLGLSSDDVSYRDQIRAMRLDADRAWQRLRAVPPAPANPNANANAARFPASFRLYPRTGRLDLTAKVFVARLAPPPRTPRPVSRRTLVLAAAAALLAVLVAGFTYRLPVAIARPGRAIDITGDVTVVGAPSHPITGRYLLLPVVYDDPPLIPLLWEVANGSRPMRWADEAELAAGRADYSAAQANAARAALAATGLDPAHVRVTFRERDIVGASAGLVYALVVADLLDADDLTRGRTIAATGQVDEAGNVSAVLFIEMKTATARGAGAHVLVVPAGGVAADDSSGRGEVVTAATVREARGHLAR